MGGTWPKWFVLKGMSIFLYPGLFSNVGKGVDLFSVATCKVKDVGADFNVKGPCIIYFLSPSHNPDRGHSNGMCFGVR
jgi:hypothetical protein